MKKKERGIYIGEVIIRLRNERNMSQEQLAYYSKLDRSFMGRLERNEAAPSLDSFYRLAKGLEMKRENLLREIDKYTNFDTTFEQEPYR